MSALHRLRYDFAKELVVAICCGVLFATFLYVFNDFLNIQVAALSTAMRESFATILAIVMLLGVAIYGGRHLSSASASQARLGNFARMIGEDHRTLRVFKQLTTVMQLFVLHGAAWLFTWHYLVKVSGWQWLGAECCLIGLTYFIWAMRRRSVASPSGRQSAPIGSRRKSFKTSTANWSSITRSAAGQFCWAGKRRT